MLKIQIGKKNTFTFLNTLFNFIPKFAVAQFKSSQSEEKIPDSKICHARLSG